MTESTVDVLWQRGIGMLAAAISFDPSSTESQELFRASLMALLGASDQLPRISLSVTPQQAAVLEGIQTELVEAVVGAIRPTYQGVMGGMMEAFVAVTHAYKRDCPDADIQGILQRLALSHATTDGE